jgi:hypothetical protein
MGPGQIEEFLSDRQCVREAEAASLQASALKLQTGNQRFNAFAEPSGTHACYFRSGTGDSTCTLFARNAVDVARCRSAIALLWSVSARISAFRAFVRAFSR